MAPDSDCLVRYGLMGHVGWFALDAAPGPRLERGAAVVIRTSRGLELGEILIVPDPEASEPPTPRRAVEDSVGTFRVVRSAGDDDLALSREIERSREPRFETCRRIVSEAGWPLELIDVEPLLDQTTVLHYLGGDDLDLGLIRARFRADCDFDVNFEDLDADRTATAEPPSAPRSGGCGDCDCGAGGCSSASKSKTKPPDEAAAAGCTEPKHGGCSSCGVAALLKDRRRASSCTP